MSEEKKPRKMPADQFKTKLSPEKWSEVQAKFEDGESVISLAQEYDISRKRIQQVSKLKGWRNPRKIALAAQRRLKTRKVNLNDAEMGMLLNKVIGVRKDLAASAVSMVRNFRKDAKAGAIKIKNPREALETLKILEAAAGIEREKEGQNSLTVIGYNVQMLAGRGHQPTDATPEQLKAAGVIDVTEKDPVKGPESDSERP